MYYILIYVYYLYNIVCIYLLNITSYYYYCYITTVLLLINLFLLLLLPLLLLLLLLLYRLTSDPSSVVSLLIEPAHLAKLIGK